MKILTLAGAIFALCIIIYAITGFVDLLTQQIVLKIEDILNRDFKTKTCNILYWTIYGVLMIGLLGFLVTMGGV